MAEASKKPAADDSRKQNQDASGSDVSLAHRHIFGFKTTVKGSVHFAEESQVLYTAGHNCLLYSMDQKTQSKVFPGAEGSEGITATAVSPNRRYLAVCEKFADRASCSIFDINTGKRRRGTLTYPDCEAKEFVCAAFSVENKFLITQGGPPDWTLVLWSWDKARPLGAVKVSNSTGSVIHECSFNPTDSNVVCVIGESVFKFFRLQEGTFKSIPNQTTKQREGTANQNYVCHTWLTDDRLVVCSESGEALLFDSGGELKGVLPCSPHEPRSLQCVAPFSKGFVAGGDNGIIRVFEKSEDAKEMYRKAKEVKAEVKDVGSTGSTGPGAGAVLSLAVNPSEEVLAIGTSTAQLLQLSLSPSDLLKSEESPVDNILTSFHVGPILGLDVCVRKPLVVTCGVDKSVRVWNYIDKTQELCKFFGEEAYSVAFHPSGFHLIVGFSDKLRLMNLLMEDMRTYKEIPIKACRECRFSHGGQFFAAVNSNTIAVYKTYTCEVVCNLRGHQGKVRSVCWTADDSRLVSTGADGAAYEFDIIKEGRKVSDYTQKGTMFTCVIAHTPDANPTSTMYVVGSDKMLQEVQGPDLKGNPELASSLGACTADLKNYTESNATLGQLALASHIRALFAGVAEPDPNAPGPLRCYTFPPNGDYAEYQAHSAPVTRIRVTCDDQYLFSTGDDGCLCIFDINKKDKNGALMVRRDKDGALGFADEILVTRGFLDDKQAALMDLERQVEELTSRIDFQLRHRDSYHKEKMAELQEKYSEEIETERRKFEVLREEKGEMELEYEDKIRALDESHSRQTQELERSFQQKMLVEVQRFRKLETDLDREKHEWEAQHAQLLKEHSSIAQSMKQDFEKQKSQDSDQQDRIIKEKDLALKQHQETLAQLERDADREIEELKEMYEQRLAQEKDEKVRLRGQAGIHKKHKETLERRMEAEQEKVKREEEKNKKAEEKIHTLMKDKDSNEKEIKERDKTIADKEQRISDLKKQNQELEKFKFVLDYKIKELKAQIDPKNDSIAEMKRQIQAMDADLEDYHRKNKQLQLSIEQLHVKQRTLQEEVVSQRKKMTDCQTIIKRFKNDLHECVQFIQEPKQLKESVMGLHKKYMPNGIKKQELDGDIQREYNRQREYLEKSVESFKRKLIKDSDVHRQDNTRILQENVALIKEINELRKEIDFLKWKRQQQKLNVNSAKAKGGGTAAKSLKDAADPMAATAEIESNATQIMELKKRIEEQRRLHASFAATAASRDGPLAAGAGAEGEA
mmetsp:Transcript_78194/g.211524  ORF Transcript_78194/g.211524 Transcript_78194/m.211524 type:complete len:1255 (-) Transcript_78194:77-3841(-)